MSEKTIIGAFAQLARDAWEVLTTNDLDAVTARLEAENAELEARLAALKRSARSRRQPGD